MRVILFTNSHWSIPLMIRLEEQKLLAGIVLTGFDHEANITIKAFAEAKEVPLQRVSREELKSDSFTTWLERLNPELGICLTFPYKIPEQVFTVPQYGIVNLHFGAFPEYGGADPLFWVLKNGERTATLSYQQMNEKIDGGPELMREQLSIFPGENYGLLGARLSQLAASSMERLFEKVTTPKTDDTGQVPVNLYKRPTQQELIIDWQNQTSDQIEALVNAANPVYGGAITYFRGAMIWILEVSPANVSNSALLGPGSIVHADQQNGVFVLCSDYRYLRLNIIKTPECILTGGKLAALGLKSGEKLGLNTVSSKQPKILV